MKRIFFIFILLNIAVAQAGFVYKTDQNFFTTADLDGDGNKDIVMVNGTNATIRIGYQTTQTNVIWSSLRSLGMESVTGIDCGNILNTPYDVLIATTPLLNRLNIYKLNSPTTQPTPSAVYANKLGPRSVVTLDVGGSDNTTNDDICSFSTMNGASQPYCLSLIRSDGTNQSLHEVDYLSVPFYNLHAIDYKTNRQGFCFTLNSGAEYFYLYDLSSGSYNMLNYFITTFSNGVSLVSFIPANTNYAEFVFWNTGNPAIETCRLSEPAPSSYQFTNSITYNLGKNISSIYLVQGSGITRLAVIFSDGQATIYNYDGNGAPTLMQNIIPQNGNVFSGLLSLGQNDFIAISAPDGDLSKTVTADTFHFNGTSFELTGTTTLSPETVNARANVMTFESEPFVNCTPRRLQLFHAGDWAENSHITAGTIYTTTKTDNGITAGLGNPQTISVGTANPAAAYTLDNQITNNISSFSLDTARGDEVASVIISPSPGIYGTSINISFATIPTNIPVYYRTSNIAEWTTYTTPFPIVADATIQYFAALNSSNTIIRNATYTFNASPDEIDTDGDGIPDYVEIANGLDPENSGLDSDGDGFSDLDELLNGTSPTNSADMPTTPINQNSVFSMVVTPLPYDGDSDIVTKSRINTSLEAFSAEGGLFDHSTTTNLSLSIPITNPAAAFMNLSRDITPQFISIISDKRFDVDSAAVSNQLGVELIGIYLLPDSTNYTVNYAWQGENMATEASNWLAAAELTYSNSTHDIEIESLSIEDTLSSMLIERKIADLLYQRTIITNRWCSLFKGRTADTAMEGLASDDIQSLAAEGTNSEPAYYIPYLITNIQNAASYAGDLLALTTNIYDICSYYGKMTNHTGRYPLPADVLRQFLYNGTLQSNYLAITTLSSQQISNAYTEAAGILSGVPQRPTAYFTLQVTSNSFDSACPVLTPVSGGTAKSLYDAKGHPYRFPETFTLTPGAEVSLYAFTDVTWNQCPGTEPLEVISLDLTAIPVSSGNDADGNLLPDDYEAMLLAGGGNSATNDLDGDGYSDLQEYLDQTDPADATSHGTTPVSMAPPTVILTQQSGNTFNFSINWPTNYASPFIFTLEYTDDLKGAPFTQTETLPQGSLSTTISSTSVTMRFFRAEMKLR